MQRNVILGSEFLLYDINQRPIAYSKNTALTLKNNLIDVTNKDSKGWSEQISGSRDFNISFEGLVSHNNEFGLDYFTDKILNGEPFFIKLGVVQNNFEYSYWGEVAIESIDINAEFDGVVSYEGKLKGVGELTFTNEGSPLQSGYLKVEDDPIFRGSAAFSITNQNKSNWNNAFDKTLQSIEFITSNNVTTLFTTLRDGSKYSSAFNNVGSGGSGEITSLNFNTNNGNLKVNNLTTSLDGRYQTIGDYISNTFLSSNYYSKIQSDDRFYLKTNPDMYLNKVTADSLYSSSGHTHTFASLTSKPTTVGGFGINDVYTKTEADGRYLQSETDTLDSVLGRGNTSDKNLNLNGDADFSKQLSIPTVVPSTLVAGKHYIYSTDIYGGTGSTTGGGGVSFYKDLADVSLFNVANGQSPVWNSTIQKWENKTVSVDLTGYALKDGSNATGTWVVNITGNASTSTLSTNWGTSTGSAQYDSAPKTVVNTYLLGYNASGSWSPMSKTAIQTFVDVNNGTTLNNTAANAILWAGQGYDGTEPAIPSYLLGLGADGKWHPANSGKIKNLAGIDNGSTLNNNISGTSALSYNSAQWNGYDLDKSNAYGTGFDLIFGRSAGINEARLITQTGMQNFVGTNNGSTLINNISGDAISWNGNQIVNDYTPAINNAMIGFGADGKWHYVNKTVTQTHLDINNGVTLNNNISGTAQWELYQSGLGINQIYGLGYDLSTNRFRPFDSSQWRVWLGSPSGGETLSSVLARGNQGNQSQIIALQATDPGNGYFELKNVLNPYGSAWRLISGVWGVSQQGFSIFNSLGSTPLYISELGNTHIGYATDQGYKLAVNGSGYFSTTLQVSGIASLNGITIASGGSGTAYSVSDLQVTRAGTYAPRLAFHWQGAVASSITIESSGRLAVMNNPGTGYEGFIAGSLASTSTITAGTSITAGTEVNAPTFHANNWFRSAGDTGWYSETYSGGIYMTDSTWVRVYGNKGFWADNQIRGTEFISQYAGFKSNNFTGLAGDYEITGTSDKIIWTIGSNWNTIESMYGIGYQYSSKYISGHQIVFRENGVVRASIDTSSGSGFFDGTVTATKIKATQNLAIPTAPPNNPESGTHYIYSSF